jgi:hypothetical protein
LERFSILVRVRGPVWGCSIERSGFGLGFRVGVRVWIGVWIRVGIRVGDGVEGFPRCGKRCDPFGGLGNTIWCLGLGVWGLGVEGLGSKKDLGTR